MGAGAIVSSIKVRAKVSSGYTVAAGEYVIATYNYQGSSNTGVSFAPAQVYYGPGDAVAASVAMGVFGGSQSLSFLTAVCFINSP
jgi:hypothetical protein